MCKNPIFMFLANFIFIISQLKTHPAVHLNTLKAHCNQKEKFIESLLAFVSLIITTR